MIAALLWAAVTIFAAVGSQAGNPESHTSAAGGVTVSVIEGSQPPAVSPDSAAGSRPGPLRRLVARIRHAVDRTVQDIEAARIWTITAARLVMLSLILLCLLLISRIAKRPP